MDSLLLKMKKQMTKKHYQTFRGSYEKLQDQLSFLNEIPQSSKLNLRLLKAQATIYAGVHDDNYEQYCKAVKSFEKTASELLIVLQDEEEQGYETESCFCSEDAAYKIKCKEDDRLKVKATYTQKMTSQSITFESFTEYAKRKTVYYKGFASEWFNRPFN